MMRRVPAVDKLERYISFKPSTSLEQIVEEVVAEQRALVIGEMTQPLRLGEAGP
jgi:hypothetical protein